MRASATRRARLRELCESWLGELARVDYDALPRSQQVDWQLLDGELRYLKKEKRLVWIQERDGESHAIDVLDGTDYGKQSKRKFKKLALNTAISSQLRGLLDNYLTNLTGHQPRMHKYLRSLSE